MKAQQHLSQLRIKSIASLALALALTLASDIAAAGGGSKPSSGGTTVPGQVLSGVSVSCDKTASMITVSATLNSPSVTQRLLYTDNNPYWGFYNGWFILGYFQTSGKITTYVAKYRSAAIMNGYSAAVCPGTATVRSINNMTDVISGEYTVRVSIK